MLRHATTQITVSLTDHAKGGVLLFATREFGQALRPIKQVNVSVIDGRGQVVYPLQTDQLGFQINWEHELEMPDHRYKFDIDLYDPFFTTPLIDMYVYAWQISR